MTTKQEPTGRRRKTATVDNTQVQVEAPIVSKAAAEGNRFAPKRTVSFANRHDSGLRTRATDALEKRMADPEMQGLYKQMAPRSYAGQIPIATIDRYGYVLPFDQRTPIETLLTMAKVEGVTYIYNEEDLQRAVEVNGRLIREGRFAETLKGQPLMIPPKMIEHGFASGREVQAAFFQESMLSGIVGVDGHL